MRLLCAGCAGGLSDVVFVCGSVLCCLVGVGHLCGFFLVLRDAAVLHCALLLCLAFLGALIEGVFLSATLHVYLRIPRRMKSSRTGGPTGVVWCRAANLVGPTALCLYLVLVSRPLSAPPRLLGTSGPVPGKHHSSATTACGHRTHKGYPYLHELQVRSPHQRGLDGWLWCLATAEQGICRRCDWAG
jgi:hypothetical protein